MHKAILLKFEKAIILTFVNPSFVSIPGWIEKKLDRGSIGTNPMYGIGSPPKKYKTTSLTLIDNYNE